MTTHGTQCLRVFLCPSDCIASSDYFFSQSIAKGKCEVLACTTMARDTPPAATSNQLCQYGEAAWSAVPQGYIQSLFHLLPRRVAEAMAYNGSYTNY
ncbi:hypothetical protein TNCV_2391481 [Trichonephila clavipes]|nr:hypothetical protein TNCV_2391481 [Trichonephila clavipes]